MSAIDQAAVRLQAVVQFHTGYLPLGQRRATRVEVELADLISLLAEHDRLIDSVRSHFTARIARLVREYDEIDHDLCADEIDLLRRLMLAVKPSSGGRASR